MLFIGENPPLISVFVCWLQVTFNNEKYLCHICWTRARRGRLSLPPVEAIPAEEISAVEEVPAEIEADDNQSQSLNEEQNVTFRLPGYCRSPNPSNSCLVHGSRNDTRHRIPKSIRVQLLINHNYYVAPFSRACQELLEDNTWDVFLTAENCCFDFNPQQTTQIIELLKQPRSHIIDFENLQDEHSAELYYWTSRTRDEFERIYNETPSLAENCRFHTPKAVRELQAKLRTGESNERLATF